MATSLVTGLELPTLAFGFSSGGDPLIGTTRKSSRHLELASFRWPGPKKPIFGTYRRSGQGITLRQRKAGTIPVFGAVGREASDKEDDEEVSTSQDKLLDGLRTSHFSRPSLHRRMVRAEATDLSSYDKSRSSLSQLHNAFNSDFNSLEADQNGGQLNQRNEMMICLSSSLCLSALMCYSGPAYASEIRNLNPVYGDVGVFLEVGVQLLYLGALLTLLGVGSFLVVRQILIKRELESAAKELQDRVRSGEATSLEYFELGAVMLRKKFFQVARKHLNDAIKKWDGSEQDLAQVYNALGFSFYSDGKIDLAITNYEKAVKLQPMYVTAWNNLADAYETQKNYVKALQAYEEALQFDPSNKVATAKQEQMKKRVERFQGIP